MRAFFRKVEITGIEHVPDDGSGIVVAWHPNGLVDGFLILTCCPQPVVFGARHGLFSIPLLGYLLRSLGTVPLYRAQDADPSTPERNRREANTAALNHMADAALDHFVAVFPEGVTHDAPQPQQLRSGAARLWLMTRERAAAGQGCPVILPVGLHYDKKHAFRSRALVAFHPPIDLTNVQEGAHADNDSAIQWVTAQIEATLKHVVHATESWTVHHTMERVRTLVRAERSARAGATLKPADMAERSLGFGRVWHAYRERRFTQPAETDRIMAAVRDYGDALRMLRLSDVDLDVNAAARMRRRWPMLLVEFAVVFFLMPPFVLLGYAVSLPAAFLLRILSHNWSESRKEQAGLKLALGMVVLPATWLLVGVIVGWARPTIWTENAFTPRAPIYAATMAIVLCALGSAIALRYQRLATELIRGLRTLITRSRKTDTVARLRRRRSELFDQLMEFSRGLDLPGSVAADGKVTSQSEPKPTTGSGGGM